MSASIVASGLKRARPHDDGHVPAVGAEDYSSKRPRASSTGLMLQQHQQPSKDAYHPRHSSHPNGGSGMVKAHRPSTAQPNGRTSQQHCTPPNPASATLHQMYQPFLGQVAAGIAAGIAATTAANKTPCSPEVSSGHGRYPHAALHSGGASAASCSSAAELLLPQLASQGINLTAFLQPMVQMVASLSAGAISSSAAGAAAGRATGSGRYSAAAGKHHATADAATWLRQQGAGAGPSAVRQGSQIIKSRVPLFSSQAKLAAQQQLATATAGWSAAAAAAGSDSCRIAFPANSAGAAAAVQDAAACWDQARTAQRHSSSTLLAVLARAMTEQGPDGASNHQHQQQQGEAHWQQQQHEQQAAGPASPDVQAQQQQPVQLQQGSWMSSSSSSAASSSAAGGAALGGLMSPTDSITGLLSSSAAASAAAQQQPVQRQQQQQQGVLAGPAQASQSSRQWQCSSSAVPSYAANVDPRGATTAGGAAGASRNSAASAAQGRQVLQHHTQQTAAHAAAAAPGRPAQSRSLAARGVQLHAERAAPGPADGQVINQQRQRILTLEQSLGNMHPHVGRAYLALSRLLYQEGSTWSLSMAHRAQQRAAHIMQGMQQAAATASFRTVQAQPAPHGSGYGRTVGKGVVLACSGSLQQQGEAALSALAAAADVADAVVRVVARRPALAGMAKQSKVV